MFLEQNIYRYEDILDTNIVIDYLSNREPFGEKAKQIFYLSESPDVELCVGNVSIDNF